MTLKKQLRWFAGGLAALYVVQVLTVSIWELVPVERRDHEGVRYEIWKGWGLPDGFIPLVGLTPIVHGEPVRLTMTDIASGRRREEGYDLASDVLAAYPRVWPYGK